MSDGIEWTSALDKSGLDGLADKAKGAAKDAVDDAKESASQAAKDAAEQAKAKAESAARAAAAKAKAKAEEQLDEPVDPPVEEEAQTAQQDAPAPVEAPASQIPDSPISVDEPSAPSVTVESPTVPADVGTSTPQTDTYVPPAAPVTPEPTVPTAPYMPPKDAHVPPAPVHAPQPVQSSDQWKPTPPPIKKTPWPMILGGLAVVAILTIGAFMFFGGGDEPGDAVGPAEEVENEEVAQEPTEEVTEEQELTEEATEVEVTEEEEPSDPVVEDPGTSILTCAANEVEEGNGCVALISASCSADGGDLGILAEVGDPFTLAASFNPQLSTIDYEFDHGDGSSSGRTPSGVYLAPGRFEATMSWSSGSQSGTELCGTFLVSGALPGWRQCDAGNAPVSGRFYVISDEVDADGLALRLSPGAEDPQGINEIVGDLQASERARFDDCLQRENGPTYWWLYEGGGWGSARYILPG